jgi:putative ABC transport system permease protein
MVRDRLRRVDPDVRVMRVAPFAELLDGPLARPRFNAFLIVVFAVVSLLLAAVGLYAVMAAYVRQRDVDLGIRVALGATARDVRRLVLSEGLGLSAVGAAVGVVVAIAATRLLRGLLFEVQPMDIPSLMGAAILLLAVSALACYLPARRAARVDPIVTLRSN